MQNKVFCMGKGQNIKDIIYKISVFALEGSKCQEDHIQNNVFCIGKVKISRISCTNKVLCYLGASLLPQYIFLIQLLFKIDENTFWCLIQLLFKNDANTLWGPLLSSVHIPYSVLIQNWWKYSLRPLSPSSTYSLFNFYSKIRPPRLPG